jgi:hypothetical protein
VHVDRLGGRSWSDVSRVSSSGRSQDLVESRGASRKEARSPRLTRSTSREKAKRYAEERSPLKVRASSACGFRPAGSRYDGRCSRALARMTLTGHTTLGPSARRSNRSHAIRKEHVTDSASVGTEAGRACLRVTTRASDGRHGSVKAPRGPRRSKGSSHPRR